MNLRGTVTENQGTLPPQLHLHYSNCILMIIIMFYFEAPFKTLKDTVQDKNNNNKNLNETRKGNSTIRSKLLSKFNSLSKNQLQFVLVHI